MLTEYGGFPPEKEKDISQEPQDKRRPGTDEDIWGWVAS